MSKLIPKQTVNDINNIIAFLAKRDVSELSSAALANQFGISRVDMIIILGSSIPYIARLGAKAYKQGLAKDIMIVGGIGHSTKYLIENVLKDNNYKDINVDGKSEADILKQIIVSYEHINAGEIIIEGESTNCGSNAYESLGVLKERKKIPKSIILMQDPTMQLRSHYSFLEMWQEEQPLIISYSPFIPKLQASGNSYEYVNEEIDGLWSIERLIDLIMGEIPRLKDDENGYGPRGMGFISHVDIPKEVSDSYKRLSDYYSNYDKIRNRS